MEFSPNEAFIISYSAEEPQGRQDRASLTLNVFDSFTGACCDDPSQIHRMMPIS